MSTRAVFTFIEEGEEYHIYKHFDGYPSKAKECIISAAKISWTLPRFEAGEFASSFIAVSKRKEGNISITSHYNKHGDLDYRYEVYKEDYDLWISAYEVLNDYKANKSEYKLIYKGEINKWIVTVN